MIIELVGLPGSGKTTLAEAMSAKGAVSVPMPSHAQLIFDASLFWLAQPMFAGRLFRFIMTRAPRSVRYAIFINGFLGYAARYRRAQAFSRTGMIAVLDQGFFQLIISLGELPPVLLKSFPKPDVLAVLETDAAVREGRMVARGRMPREEFGTKNRLAWQRNAETALQVALPSIEKTVSVYRYDGTRDPQESVAMLMALAVKKARVSSVRNLLKTAVAGASFLIAQFTGIGRRTSQVVVLMYHAIDRSGWKLSVTPEEFERHMKYLARKNATVSLADIVSYVKGEKDLQSHAVAITFDDGYLDVLKVVLPILKRYSIPATVFIPSDLSVRTDSEGRERLTEEGLRTLAQSPLIDIGSHAKTHRKYTELSPEEIQSESEESADTLARIVGERPRFFAYPFGARSAEVERAVKDSGYEAAFGITEGTIRPGDDLFRLKRVQIDGTMSFFLFRLRITSAIDWNRRIVDSLRGVLSI